MYQLPEGRESAKGRLILVLATQHPRLGPNTPVASFVNLHNSADYSTAAAEQQVAYLRGHCR